MLAGGICPIAMSNTSHPPAARDLQRGPLVRPGGHRRHHGAPVAKKERFPAAPPLPLHAANCCRSWQPGSTAEVVAPISGSPHASGFGAARPRSRSRSYDAVCVLALAVHTAARRRPPHGIRSRLAPATPLLVAGSLRLSASGWLRHTPATSSHGSSWLRASAATTCRLAAPPPGLARPAPRARLLAPLVAGRLLRPPLRAPLAYRPVKASMRVAVWGSVGHRQESPALNDQGRGGGRAARGQGCRSAPSPTLARHGHTSQTISITGP
jgi:hypothetical protein